MTPCRRTAVVALAALLADVAAPAVAGASTAEPAPPPAACRTRAVFVAVTGPDGSEVVEFRRSVVDALLRDGCYRPVDPVASLEAGMAVGLQRVESGKQALDQGQQAFLDMRVAPAIRFLEQAVEEFSAAFGHLSHPGPMVEALLILGAARAVNGDVAGARKAFVGALHLRPDADVSDVTALPEPAAAFGVAKSVVGAGRTGSLLVDSEPSGAEVHLDGTYVGATPYDQTAVPAGPHWVVLRKAGFERKSTPIEVPDGETVSILGQAAALSPSRRRPLYETAMAKLSKAGPERGAKDGIEDLKALFLSDLLLVFDPAPGGLAASLWDLETMERVWSGVDTTSASGFGRGAAEDLVSRAIGAHEARGRVVESGAATMKARGGVASKWWFWTVLGVVVVGGATTAAILLTRGGSGGPNGLPRDGSGAVVVRF